MTEDEIGTFIGSDKVTGTPVFGPDGERAGYIERVMIDKLIGQVEYAVLRVGSLLDDGRYPLPWQSLKYDPDLGGYLCSVTTDQLGKAPRYSNEADWSWEEPSGGTAVSDYYKNLT